MMSEKNIEEQTQPVMINPEEAIQTKASSVKLNAEIPEWLLDFAASQPTVVEATESETEEDAIPVVMETSAWHTVQAELEDLSPKSDANLDDLLKNGHFSLAAELLREQANDVASIEEAQRKIRPALTLSEELNPLWDLYDELAVKLNQLKQNSANNGG